MVLPKISTNVSVWPTEPDGDPLDLVPALGAALRAAAGANPGAAVARPAFLRAARTRSGAARASSPAPGRGPRPPARNRSAPRMSIPVLFRRQLDTHQISFAMGEAIAHLNHLMYQHKITRTQDASGVLRFQRDLAHHAEPGTTRPPPIRATSPESLSQIAERSQNLVNEYLERQREGKIAPITDDLGLARAFTDLAMSLMSNPWKLAEVQMQMWQDYCEALAERHAAHARRAGGPRWSSPPHPTIASGTRCGRTTSCSTTSSSPT